ncbi:MAG: class I SAM-dependent methyltransferase [Thermoanaerobaculia bacterium]
MTPAVYAVFEDVCREAGIRGAVLEVGAVPGPDGLLGMECLKGASRRVGLNLDGPVAGDGWEILPGDAHDMPFFETGSFAAVLCNATLAHDPRFWKTLAEIRRVTAPGGLIVIGVPGYAGMGAGTFAPRDSFLGRALHLLACATKDDALLAGTVTLGEHAFPGDYYRFTEHAMREVFLEGLRDVRVRTVARPPRIIGWGRNP